MAVHSIDSDYTLLTPIDFQDQAIDSDHELAGAYSVSGFTAKYMNKAWNTVHGQWAYWLTDAPDTIGTYYPGPGNFSDCTNYRIETTQYQ